MNKKLQHFLIAISMAPCTVQAQSLKDLFLKMPQEVCPVLSEYNRLELVDNQKNNKPMQTRNQFRTFSTMETLTDDYAHLIVSEGSEKEMKLLTLNDNSQVIMMVNTVFCDSIADSSICFYTTDWQPLDAATFVSSPTSTLFRRINIDPTSGNLTILTSSPLDIPTEGDKQHEPVSSTLLWNGGSFQQN